MRGQLSSRDVARYRYQDRGSGTSHKYRAGSDGTSSVVSFFEKTTASASGTIKGTLLRCVHCSLVLAVFFAVENARFERRLGAGGQIQEPKKQLKETDALEYLNQVSGQGCVWERGVRVEG